MSEEVIPGGGFLAADVPLGKIFSREEFTDVQREILEMTAKFMQNEVIPRTEELDHKAEEDGGPLMVKLSRKIAELGCMSVVIPEELGGLAMDETTAMIVAEGLAGCASFSATLGAHSGIGTLPILYFGNEVQKQEWLPKLASFEKISCYGLTEPGAGSDALSGRTVAVPTEDKQHFLLSGEKQFITNAAWADVAIVFAQVGGKYTGFIVDLHSPGVTRGPEEKKMGIKGSSTTSLTFDEVKVPATNMLGQVGMAPQIALNILNIGRLKLGFGALGNCKYSIDLAVKYGRERKQFGQPIITFDMQKGKLADIVAETFALDALSYRAMGDIEHALATLEHDASYYEKAVETVRGYALECSIVKVAGSEALQDVAAIALRMHGGYGFIQEYKLEMIARDNVVDTIFEGTNDINRLTMFDTLARAIFGAQLPFRQMMEMVDAELASGNLRRARAQGPLADEIADTMAAKKVVAYAINHALIHCGKNVKNEQQVMQAISDAIIALYKMESTVSRAQKIVDARGEKACATQIAIAQLVTHKSVRAITELAERVLTAVATPGQLPDKLARHEKLASGLCRPMNIVRIRRTIADAVIEAGGYKL